MLMKKFITLLLVLTGMVSTASAATKTTVYYAVPSATVGTYSVRLNVAREWNSSTKEAYNWAQYVMTKTGKTYDGADIYTCTYTDLYDGVGTMQFQLYDGSTWKSQKVGYSADSWTAATAYNGKMYVHNTESWTSYRTDVKVYLKPNSNWSGASAWFAIYLEDNNSNNTWQKFTAVDGHTGYYSVAVSGKWTKFVLCRMNSGDTSTMSWGNTWNQCPKPEGDGRISLQSTLDACYEITGDVWNTDTYGYSLVPWEYYFMSGTGDSWSAKETMIKSSSTYTYSFSGDAYASKRVAWAPGSSFNDDHSLKSWDDVCKSKTTPNDDEVIGFQSFSYADVVIGSTGSAWSVPASNDGIITIAFNTSDESATITSAKTTTIGDAGYSTWSNGEKYEIANTTNVTDVFTVSASDESTVTLKSVKGSTFAAGTGVVIKGSGVVTVNSVAGDATPSSIGTNYLVGSGNSTAEITAATGIYIFNWDGSDTSSVGFYKANNGTLGAHKAYLDIRGVSAHDFLGFDFENTTGIKAVNSNSAINGEYFNLAGQRVAQPTKGLYIVNGKKVIIK